MTDGMSLGRQQAGQLAGTPTGPPERGHRIAPSIRVNQSFQCLDQLGVVLDQSLPSSSGVPYSLNGEMWLSKALDSPIDGRTREPGNTGDAGNTSSSQLLCIDGSDKVLLPLIQVRQQQAVFLLEFFSCAHTDSVTHRASFVTIINLLVLTCLRLLGHIVSLGSCLCRGGRLGSGCRVADKCADMSWLRDGSLGRHIGSYRSGHEPGNTGPNPDPLSALDTNRDRGVWESDRHLPPCLRSEVPAPVSCLPRLPRPSCPLMRSPRHQDSGHCNQSVFFRSQLNRFPSDPPALPITPAVQLASRCSSRSSGRGRRSSDREW